MAKKVNNEEVVKEEETVKKKSKTKKKSKKETVKENKALIRSVELKDEINKNKNTYAYSINLYRSFLDVRDGQKVVARRILYAMEQMKANKLTKVSAVTGRVLELYHAHGEASVNDAIIKLGQWFYNSYPLLDIHGKNNVYNL